jgi:hypothetical protein
VAAVAPLRPPHPSARAVLSRLLLHQDRAAMARCEAVPAFAWDITGKLMTIKLEKEMFSEVLGWPPKMHDKHVVHLVVSFLSHAIDMMYWSDSEKLRKAVSKALYQQIEDWASEPEKIAPFFYNRVIGGVVLH